MLDEKDIQVIQEMMDKQEQRILEQSAANMRVILESYVEPKFNLLAEGQKNILEAMTPKSEIEELRGEVDLLKMVIRAMSADIAELKKAQ